MEFFPYFTWAVPQAFSDALAFCRFEEGDVLYDTAKAYEGRWAEAKGTISHHIQVRYPPSGTSNPKGEGRGVFEKNWVSEVRFELFGEYEGLVAGINRSTQGRLYTALWKGDLNVLNIESAEPEIPLNVNQVTKQLKNAKIESSSVKALDSLFFIMARDFSSQVSKLKYSKIYSKLKSHMPFEPIIKTPKEAELELWETIAPTVEIVFFELNGINQDRVIELVKEAVYVPSKNAKKDKFRIGAHGEVKNGND